MIKSNKNLLLAIFVIVCGFSPTVFVKAATTINLGTADGYAVLAGSTITNTGSTTITGDLGLFPGSSVTGFPPGIINGSQQITTAAANQAQVDLLLAYSAALSQPVTSTIPTQLGSTTVVGGVYNSAAGTFGITGTVTLDGQNNPDTVFIFKADSTLITAGTSSVVLINGAQACNVFWLVGSSATLGSNSIFKGTIIASSSITLTTGVNVEGRALAIGAATTLDSNTVSKPTCITTNTNNTTIIIPISTFVSGPMGVVFGSAPVMPSWAVATTSEVEVKAATTTKVQVVNSTTTMILKVNPKFPNTGFGDEGKNLLMYGIIFLVVMCISSVKLFSRKNIKTI